MHKSRESLDRQQAATETKIEKLWAHLQSGKPITGKQAWQLWGYYRLSSGIMKLRKRHPDIRIQMEMIQERGERFGVYYIATTDYITLSDGKKKGRAYNVAALDKFFADPFTVHIRPDCIIFLRASQFTRNGLHQGYFNGRSYLFHITSDEELPLGRYINQRVTDDDQRVYVIPRKP